MKKYWMVLYPDVFLWCKGEKGLLYHSALNKSFVFDNKGRIRELTEQLLQPENLYCIEVTEELYRQHEVFSWCYAVTDCQAGKLVDQEEGKKPVSFMPVLNLQKDVDRLRGDTFRTEGEDLLTYLHEVILYIGGRCEVAGEYYRQVLYPVHSERMLEVGEIIRFLRQTVGSGLRMVHILGGDLLEYAEKDKLLKALEEFPVEKCFYFLDQEFVRNKTEIRKFIGENCRLKLICEKAFLLNEAIDYLRVEKITVDLIGVVQSANEYQQMMDIIQECQWETFEVKPVYTGHNMQFFVHNVFVTEEDVQHPGLNRRQVFAHQVLNTHFFGQLTIMPDGQVYGNVNRKALGSINDSLYTLLYREMDKPDSWRRIRDDLPCRKCVYQWLCPSPSGYEFVMKRPDLCRITQREN